MTTLTIRSNSAQAKLFIAYARSLPYVKVADKERTQLRFRPCVEKSLRESKRGVGLTEFANLDDMYQQIGLTYAKTRRNKTV